MLRDFMDGAIVPGAVTVSNLRGRKFGISTREWLA
jgi:hypothetical protein